VKCNRCWEAGIVKKRKLFHFLLASGLISVIFDAATAYTVNYIGQVENTGCDIAKAR